MLCSFLQIIVLENDNIDMMTQESRTYLLQCFAWSALWALGSNLTHQSKVKLEIFIREMFRRIEGCK